VRHRRSSFLKSLEERIVVLRAIEQVDVDDTVTGNLTFGQSTYPRNQFEVIIFEWMNVKGIILKDRTTFDPEGISTAEVDYVMNISPPQSSLKVGDILIRIDREFQDLYIESISQVRQVQQCELIIRSKTDNARF